MYVIQFTTRNIVLWQCAFTVVQMISHLAGFNTRNKLLTYKLFINKAISTINFTKSFENFIDGGSDFRLYEGSDLKTNLLM